MSNPPVSTRWKPGQSGNPKGRPKGTKTLTTLIREALEENDAELAKKLVRSAIDHAIAGDFRYCNMIWERLEGKVPDSVVSDGSYTIKRIELIDHRQHDQTTATCRREYPPSSAVADS